LYIKNQRGKKATVKVNGDAKTYEVDRGITIDCGRVLSGHQIEVEFEIDAGGGGTFYLFAAEFNEETFAEGYNILNKNGLNVTKFSDTDIKGEITAESDGLLFTSIPYDKGWSVKIDGKSQEINPKSASELNNPELEDNVNNTNGNDGKKDQRKIEKITDGFVTVPLTAGAHTIEFSYSTYGFIPGAIISLVSILAIVLWELYNRKFALKNKPESKKSAFENVISKGAIE
jgi:uncharacterized membrane protein YfhO